MPIYGITDCDIILGYVDFESDFSCLEARVDSVTFLGVFGEVGLVFLHILGIFLGGVAVSLGRSDRLGGKRRRQISLGYFIAHFGQSLYYGFVVGIVVVGDFCSRILTYQGKYGRKNVGVVLFCQAWAVGTSALVSVLYD